MATLGEFSILIVKLGNDIELGVTRLVRRIALQIDQGLVLRSPVDTGRFRSNWLVNINAPDRGTREPYSPGEGLGRSEGANSQAALAHGRKVIGQYRGGEGTSIWISNNVDYAAQLADGRSAQAKRGWVRKSVNIAIAAARGTPIISNGRLVI